MTLCCSLSSLKLYSEGGYLPHLEPPFAVAEDGDDDIKGVKGSLERNVFMEVEDTGDHVNGDPNEPLFEVLVGECPDADKTECGGKRVGNGDCGVGESGKQPPDGAPQCAGDAAPAQGKTYWNMSNGEFCAL